MGDQLFKNTVEQYGKEFKIIIDSNIKDIFEEYVNQFCKNIDPNIAWNYAIQGLTFLQNFYAGQSFTIDHILFPVCLTWGLTCFAIAQRKQIVEGMFVVEDMGTKLFQFLLKQKKRYQRMSSHFSNRSSCLKYGLDIDQRVTPLPAKKRTLLFGHIHGIDKTIDLLYIKPENFGCHINILSFSLKKTWENLYSMYRHIFELIQSLLNRRFPKYIPPVGSDNDALLHEENLSSKEANSIKQLQKKIEACFPHAGYLNFSQIKKYGIAAALCNFQKISECLPKHLSFEQQETLQQIIDQMHSWQQGGLQHLSIRKGYEIVVRKQDFSEQNFKIDPSL